MNNDNFFWWKVKSENLSCKSAIKKLNMEQKNGSVDTIRKMILCLWFKITTGE